jgi:hypothetical protein
MNGRSTANLHQKKGQSFVELALVIPLLLLVLAGMVELGFFIFTYLNALDLTREAARFASTRDYHQATSGPTTLAECTNSTLDYYKDTACFFIDPNLNPYIPITNTLYSDVVITVFTVSNDVVTDRWPEAGNPGPEDNQWTLYGDNWQKDCHGNVVRTEPFFTNDQMNAMFASNPDAPKNKGVVLVEVYYCYNQILSLPVLTEFLPTPIRMHAFSLMPDPEAIPTPTSISSP